MLDFSALLSKVLFAFTLVGFALLFYAKSISSCAVSTLRNITTGYTVA